MTGRRCDRGARREATACAEALALRASSVSWAAWPATSPLTLGARGGVYIGGGIVPHCCRNSSDPRFANGSGQRGGFGTTCARFGPGSSDQCFAGLRRQWRVTLDRRDRTSARKRLETGSDRYRFHRPIGHGRLWFQEFLSDGPGLPPGNSTVAIAATISATAQSPPVQHLARPRGHR